MVDKASFIIKDVFTLLNSAMCLNSIGNVQVSDISAFLLCENTKKDEFASILTAWFYFVFAKKFDIPVRKYVHFMYQVSSISKLLTLISLRTDNFGGKIGCVSFTFFSYRLCNLSSQYNDILQRTN